VSAVEGAWREQKRKWRAGCRMLMRGSLLHSQLFTRVGAQRGERPDSSMSRQGMTDERRLSCSCVKCLRVRHRRGRETVAAILKGMLPWRCSERLSVCVRQSDVGIVGVLLVSLVLLYVSRWCEEQR